MLATGGYPDQYRKGDRITGLEAAAALPDTVVFMPASNLSGCPVTNGGRVLSVSALGADLPTAVANAYKAARLIKFDGVYMRKDIGARGLNAG